MKNSNYVMLIFLIAFLTGSAYGFAGMTTNQSIPQTSSNMTTESDQDLLLLFHLVEIDAIQLQSENRLSVQETLVFKNSGALNFSGSLRTWVPDGVEGIKIERRNMMDGTLEYPIMGSQEGNIISWEDKIDTQSLPPLYSVKYDIAAEPKGTITTTKQYVKKFFNPTLTKQPGSIAIKVTKSNDESIAIKDENGNRISESGNPKEEGNSVLFNWEAPQFRETTLDISKTVFPAGIAVYVIIGALILLVISYPILRKKSEKVKSIEETIKASFKKESKETVEGESPEESIPAAEEEQVIEEDSEFRGMAKEELENQKNELVLKLRELEKKYSSGDLMDEEYEEQQRYYQEKINKIQRSMEKS